MSRLTLKDKAVFCSVYFQQEELMSFFCESWIRWWTKTIQNSQRFEVSCMNFKLCDQSDWFRGSRSNICRLGPKFYWSIRTQSKSLGFGLLTLPLLLTALSSSSSASSSSELELPELVDGGMTLSRVLETSCWSKNWIEGEVCLPRLGWLDPPWTQDSWPSTFRDTRTSTTPAQKVFRIQIGKWVV